MGPVKLRVFTEPQQGATYDDQLASARTAQECGFDAWFRSDHYLAMGDGDGMPGPTDAWVTLAGLARETERIRLGTLVSPATFRLPGPLAIQVAQVDRMSGGRVELGLGAGWFEAEHTAYGIPFPGLGERFDRLEEQLAVVTGSWSTPEGERFTHRGKHHTLVDSPALPRPAQDRVPLIIGGGGPRRTPALAARFATEFNTGFTDVDTVARRFAGVRAACEAAGRDPGELRYSVALAVFCGRTDAEVAARLAAAGRDDRDVLATQGLVGSPARVVERIGAYAAVGADTVYVQVLDMTDRAHLELVAAEVMPSLG